MSRRERLEAREFDRKVLDKQGGDGSVNLDPDKLQQIIEGILLAAGKPLNLLRLQALFADSDPRPGRDEILAALESLERDLDNRGCELKQVASGYRLQVREELSPWVGRLWEEKPQRYSRALLETLALVAYRQPITRGEIEEVRGVAVSTNIMRTLLERDWVRVVGHRDVPGKPAMYASTRAFLDYFNLKSLDELPSLAEIHDLDSLVSELESSVAMPDAVTPNEGPENEPDADTDSELPLQRLKARRAASDAATADTAALESPGANGDAEEAGASSRLPSNVISLPTS